MYYTSSRVHLYTEKRGGEHIRVRKIQRPLRRILSIFASSHLSRVSAFKQIARLIDLFPRISTSAAPNPRGGTRRSETVKGKMLWFGIRAEKEENVADALFQTVYRRLTRRIQPLPPSLMAPRTSAINNSFKGPGRLIDATYRIH